MAYRYFSTEKRKFIVADTPGHEQYTRNMITAASTADLAVILIDARKGVLTQTRRHAYLASLLGIRRIVVAINKMDLVEYSASVFDRTKSDYQRLRLANRRRDVDVHPDFGSLRIQRRAAVGDDALVHRPDAPRAPRERAHRQMRSRRNRSACRCSG